MMFHVMLFMQSLHCKLIGLKVIKLISYIIIMNSPSQMESDYFETFMITLTLENRKNMQMDQSLYLIIDFTIFYKNLKKKKKRID
jgi:hypothetical protein